MLQFVECQPNVQKDRGSLQHHIKLRAREDTCNWSMQEVEARGSEVQGHPAVGQLGMHENFRQKQSKTKQSGKYHVFSPFCGT